MSCSEALETEEDNTRPLFTLTEACVLHSEDGLLFLTVESGLEDSLELGSFLALILEFP